MGQVTVFSGVQRRRYWSDEQKHALVSAISAPGANVAEISRLADEMMGILTELAGKSEEGPVTDAMDGDLNLEFKTHTLGDPDGEDNIEGDWNLDEEDLIPLNEAHSIPEAEEFLAKKEKKGKKHGKKDKKKGKKGKKGRK